jgi:hypothetical protein
VHLIHLDGFQRGLEFIQLEWVEIFGSPAGPFQESLHGAGIHVADVGGGLDGTAMSQALDDPDDRWQRQLAVFHEGALAFAEPAVADAAVQSTDGLVFARMFGDGQIAGPEEVEGLAVGVGTGEEFEGPRQGMGLWAASGAGAIGIRTAWLRHTWPPCQSRSCNA